MLHVRINSCTVFMLNHSQGVADGHCQMEIWHPQTIWVTCRGRPLSLPYQSPLVLSPKCGAACRGYDWKPYTHLTIPMWCEILGEDCEEVLQTSLQKQPEILHFAWPCAMCQSVEAGSQYVAPSNAMLSSCSDCLGYFLIESHDRELHIMLCARTHTTICTSNREENGGQCSAL